MRSRALSKIVSKGKDSYVAIFREIAVILNPASGRGKAGKLREKIRALLSECAETVLWQETERPGHATELARAVPDSAECVVVAGGDGTVNEVVNGLIGRKVPLAVLPVGSGNDFARALGLPFNYRKAFKILCKKAVKWIDVGKVNGRYYPNALGLGFDADVVVESNKIHRLRGILIYLYAVIKNVFKFRPYRVRVHLDGRTVEKEVLLLTVANGISLGGGFKLTPTAKNDDGLFDVCMIETMPRPLIFWHLPKIFWGGHVKIKQTSMFQAKRVVVEAITPIGGHVDGEHLGKMDHYYEVELLPKALPVIWNAEMA